MAEDSYRSLSGMLTSSYRIQPSPGKSFFNQCLFKIRIEFRTLTGQASLFQARQFFLHRHFNGLTPAGKDGLRHSPVELSKHLLMKGNSYFRSRHNVFSNVVINDRVSPCVIPDSLFITGIWSIRHHKNELKGESTAFGLQSRVLFDELIQDPIDKSFGLIIRKASG